MKFTQLHPHLFLRGHTRNIDSGSMIYVLEELKINTVINVALICDEPLRAAMALLGMEYIHEPLSDSKEIPEATVKALVAKTVSRVQSRCGTLIHCDSGRNRSALVAIPALAELTGRPTSELLAEIRDKRRIARGVLDNKAFEKFVLSYVSRLESIERNVVGGGN